MQVHPMLLAILGILLVGVGIMEHEKIRHLISRITLGLVTGWEGYSSVPYRDQAGDWTIGYGHKMQPDEPHAAITPTQARKLLTQDLHDAAATVADAVTVPLTDTEGAALVDFAFNVGDENFRTSTLLRMLNAGDYQGAAGQFGRWDEYTDADTGKRVVDRGLSRRRLAEKKLFLS